MKKDDEDGGGIGCKGKEKLEWNSRTTVKK
jgi:hypothetical protein